MLRPPDIEFEGDGGAHETPERGKSDSDFPQKRLTHRRKGNRKAAERGGQKLETDSFYKFAGKDSEPKLNFLHNRA